MIAVDVYDGCPSCVTLSGCALWGMSCLLPSPTIVRHDYDRGQLHFGLSDCMARADVYYYAVTERGQGPFDEAQEKCKCTPQ